MSVLLFWTVLADIKLVHLLGWQGHCRLTIAMLLCPLSTQGLLNVTAWVALCKKTMVFVIQRHSEARP